MLYQRVTRIMQNQPTDGFIAIREHNEDKSNDSFFWDTMRRKIVRNRRFGTTYNSHLQGSGCPRRNNLSLEEGPIGIPETLVCNHITPSNNPEDGRIQFNLGESQRSLEYIVENYSKTKYNVSYFFCFWCFGKPSPHIGIAAFVFYMQYFTAFSFRRIYTIYTTDKKGLLNFS